LALVLHWCQQGKPCWEEPQLVIDGELRALEGCPTGRSPRWSADGRLAVSSDERIVILEGGVMVGSLPVVGLHSMDWLPAMGTEASTRTGE